MPRTRKASENEPETKPVRRTRQTSVVTDSPVRRSTRNKQRSRSPSIDIIVEDASPRPTRSLRSRNKKSETEIPPSPVRTTRRTRATSVADVIPKSKKAIPLKGRKRLTSVPVEISILEDKTDNEKSPENSIDEADSSSKETSFKSKSDQSDQNTSKEDEIDDSHVATEEESIIFVNEVNDVKSHVKKKEKVQELQKHLMKRLISNKLNFTDNDSILEIKKEQSLIDSDKSEDESPGERENSLINNTMLTPEKIETSKRKATPYPHLLNHSKTIKKRVSDASNIETDEKIDDEDCYYEPIDVAPNNSNQNLNLSVEKIVVPERTNRDFKPRNSMIETASEKLMVSKSRSSLGNKKPEFVDIQIKLKRQEKKNRKSLSTENSEPDENNLSIPSVSGEKRFSIEKRKSVDNSSKKTSKSPSFELSVTPDKEEFLKSNKAEISKSAERKLSKSIEKISRKRKRVSSDFESDLTMYEYDSMPESDTFPEGNEELDSTKENFDDSANKKKRKSLDSMETANKEKSPRNVEKMINFSGDSKQDEIFTFTGKKTTPREKNRKSESFEEGEISDSDGEAGKENSKFSDSDDEMKSKFFDKILDKKSKSRSLGGSEIVSKSSTRNCKSLDKMSLQSLSSEKETKKSTGSDACLKNVSNNETDSDSSVSVENAKKPTIKNIEILMENDSLISKLKSSRKSEITEKTANNLNKSKEKIVENLSSAPESSEEESSDQDEVVTVKLNMKNLSKAKTPTPKKNIDESKDNVNSGKKSNLSRKLDEDSEDSVSKIPTFMFSQTSESEETEDASKSIDSDIAREYNLSGKHISRYSDDDVPGDDCRGSESEHSDSDDDGSDLADFINDDEEHTEDSETEHYEENEDRDKEPEIQKVTVIDDDDDDDEEEKTDNSEDDKEDDNNENNKEDNEDGKSEDDNEDKNKDDNQDKNKNYNQDKNKDYNQDKNKDANKKDDDEEIDNKEEGKDDDESDDSVFEVDLKSSLELHKTKMLKKQKESESKSQKETIQLEKNKAKKRRKSASEVEIVNLEEKEEEKEDETSSDEIKTPIAKKLPPSNSPVVSKSRSDQSLSHEEQNHETLKESPDLEELIAETKRKRKSKRKLKSTAAKVPVASSTHYELSDSDDEPQSLSFAEALVRVADNMKKKAETIKKVAKTKETRKHKKQFEENAARSEAEKMKRLPDEILQELEDVPRPKKRLKMINKESTETQPCPGCSHKTENAASVSSFGSTTEFDVVNLRKEKKPKTQSNLAMKWFRQRMLARNTRQPISAYLSQQQKKRAANKDRFAN